MLHNNNNNNDNNNFKICGNDSIFGTTRPPLKYRPMPQIHKPYFILFALDLYEL